MALLLLVAKKLKSIQLPKSVARSQKTGESSSLKQTTYAQTTGRAIARPNLHKWKPALRLHLLCYLLRMFSLCCVCSTIMTTQIIMKYSQFVQELPFTYLTLRSFGDQSNHDFFIQSQPAVSNFFETKQC